MRAAARSIRLFLLAACLMVATVVASITGSTFFGGAGTGRAAEPLVLNGGWAAFTRCPIDDPVMLGADGVISLNYCVAAQSMSGSIKLGSTQAESGPSNIQFGLVGRSPFNVVSPASGAIAADPVDVPGGLLGLMCPSSNMLVRSICGRLTNSALNRVTAAVEDAGPPSDFDFNAGFQLGVPLMTLPIKVHLQNPLLGPSCYIGSDADPIILRPANTDLSQFSLNFSSLDTNGTFDSQNGTILLLEVSGASQGDDTFAVPGATGCGVAGLLNTAINAKTGLPSPSGNNSIVLRGGSTKLITWSNPAMHLPDAGAQFSAAWHSAVCDPDCPTPTPTPDPDQ